MPASSPKLAYLDCAGGLDAPLLLEALVAVGAELPPSRPAFTPDAWRDEPRLASAVQAAALPAAQLAHVQAVFAALAQAAARLEGRLPEQIDLPAAAGERGLEFMLGIAAALDGLHIEQLYTSPLPYPGAQPDAGLTLAVLAGSRLPLQPAPDGRPVPITPLGAAIVAALAHHPPPAFHLSRAGVGSGPGHPPLGSLRLCLGQALAPPAASPERLMVLETNIDNMNAEFYGHVMARLFAAGARDVWLTPIYMKKNRPATLLGVLAREQDQAALADLILRETTTLGVRLHPVYRFEAGRRLETVATAYGPILVKLKLLDGEVVAAAPEYEACRQAAEQHGLPLAQVYAAAWEAGLRLVTAPKLLPPDAAC